MDWFGYELDFAGIEWVGPVLGSVIFGWGGWPFLQGGWREARARQPGMMLLIAMAITVAYTASIATSLGWFDLDFWWELSLLVTIMLLGHWQEMKALGQAQDALSALAALLPDEAERIGLDGRPETVTLEDLRTGDVVLVRAGGRVPADGAIVEGTAALDESMITGESRPVTKGVGDRVVGGTVSTDSSIRVRVDAVGDDTALGRDPAPGGPGPGVEVARAGPRRSCRGAPLLRGDGGRGGDRRGLAGHRRHRRGGRASRDGARHLLPARPRPRHPADHLTVVGHRSSERDPGEGPPRPGAEPHRRRLPVRQDRHPHQGRAHRGRCRRRRPDRRRGAPTRGGGRVRQRAPSGPRHRGGGAPTWPGSRRHRRPVDHRPWCGSARRRRAPRRGWAGAAARAVAPGAGRLGGVGGRLEGPRRSGALPRAGRRGHRWSGARGRGPARGSGGGRARCSAWVVAS